ncbi:hypothetical protein FHG87_003587, partial [Trinorchestia longiramus]
MADPVVKISELSSSLKKNPTLSTEFRGEPDGCVSSGSSGSPSGQLAEGKDVLHSVGSDHGLLSSTGHETSSVHGDAGSAYLHKSGDHQYHVSDGLHLPSLAQDASSLACADDVLCSGAPGPGRPYSLYDFGRKFYTLSEASLRSSKSHFPDHNSAHSDITKGNSIGKCNSVVVEVARSGQFVRSPSSRPTAYSHIEKFNRTLESEGIYMRNIRCSADRISKDDMTGTLRSSASKRGKASIRCTNGNGSIVTINENSAYGTVPRTSNFAPAVERIYGGGIGGGFVVDMAAVVERASVETNGGVSGAVKVDELSAEGISSLKEGGKSSTAGRLKRVKRSGLLGLKMGRFTKNSAKKNSTKPSAMDDSTMESPGEDAPVSSSAQPSRASSLDHLNFEEKRKLIASSLSLSEVLGAEGNKQPRNLLCGTDDGDENIENITSQEKGLEDLPDAGRRWQKLGGIGLVGMGSNNSSPLSTYSRPNHLARPSTPSPLIHASTSEASIPVRPASVCGINSTSGYNNSRDNSVVVLL